MNKRVRNLVIVLSCVVLLAGSLVALLVLVPESSDSSGESSEPPDPSVELLSKNKDENGDTVDSPVTKMSVKLKDETFTLSRGEDHDLRVDSYAAFPVNTYTVESLEDYVSDITAAREVAPDSSGASEFGLDKPAAELNVTYHDGESRLLQIGGEAPSDAGYYFRLDGKGAIYLIDSMAAEAMMQASVMYIGTTMVSPPETTESDETPVVYSMKLGGSSREKPISLRIRRDDDDPDLAHFPYVLTSPYWAGTDLRTDSVVNSMMSATSLTATQAVKANPTPDDLKKYGLDKPFSTNEMSMSIPIKKDDETTDYKVFTYYTVLLGSKDKDGNYYAMVKSNNKLTDVVYLVPSDSVPWAESKWENLAANTLFLIDIATVSKLSITFEGKTTVFDLTHVPDEEDRDKSLIVKAGDKTYPTDAFRSLYTVMMEAYRYGPLEKTPSGNPDIVIKLERTKDSFAIRTIRFYRQDASLYACVFEGGESYTVKNSDITYVIDQLNNYLAGNPIVTR